MSVRRSIAVIVSVMCLATVARAAGGDALTPSEKAVVSMAGSSACAKYSWRYNQGVAPRGFPKGVALSYARSYCKLNTADSAVQVMAQPLGDEAKDALAFYSAMPAIPSETPVERLRSVYALSLGLGMLESSGRPTIAAPYDSANPHPSSETAEAGLFQTSWDSRGKSPALLPLYDAFKADPSNRHCHFATFMEGVKHPLTGPIGDNAGAEFQQFTKTCPGFATAYVAIMLRVNRKHYGPVKSHPKAEHLPICVAMFKQVEAIINCEELN